MTQFGYLVHLRPGAQHKKTTSKSPSLQVLLPLYWDIIKLTPIQFLWPSVADHMKARKDPKFAKAGPALFKVATKNKAMMHFDLESLSPTKAKL